MIKVVIICDSCKRDADFRALTVLTTERRASQNGWAIKLGDKGDLCPACVESEKKANGV